MSRYRRLETRRWHGLRGHSDRFKLLMVYAQTGPETTLLPGLLQIGEQALAEALEWPLKTFQGTFAQASKEGLIEACWDDRLVLVPEALEVNRPDNPNTLKSWAKEFAEISDRPLKAKWFQLLRVHAERWGEGFVKALETFPATLEQTLPGTVAPQDQDQDQEQEQKSPLPPPRSVSDRHLHQLADEILEKYPGKGSHDSARRWIVRLIKEHPPELDPSPAAVLMTCVANYRASLAARETTPEYILAMHNFFGKAARWKEYLAPGQEVAHLEAVARLEEAARGESRSAVVYGRAERLLRAAGTQ